MDKRRRKNKKQEQERDLGQEQEWEWDQEEEEEEGKRRSRSGQEQEQVQGTRAWIELDGAEILIIILYTYAQSFVMACFLCFPSFGTFPFI